MLQFRRMMKEVEGGTIAKLPAKWQPLARTLKSIYDQIGQIIKRTPELDRTEAVVSFALHHRRRVDRLRCERACGLPASSLAQARRSGDLLCVRPLALGCEGIVSKRRGSRNARPQSSNWLKIKILAGGAAGGEGGL
jgi:hypothetical protein